MYLNARKCKCGAISVTIDGVMYAMRPHTFKKTFKKTPPRKRTLIHCNHCVNNWGTDLCGCGSGAAFGKCGNRLPECSLPSQSIAAGRQNVTANGSWL